MKEGSMSKGHPAKSHMTLLLRQEAILEMLSSGILIDGRKGGLVVGPSHEEGNIFLLYQCQADKYTIIGTMEGGEYLLSHMTYLLYRDRINIINAWDPPATSLLQKDEIPSGVRVINAFGETSEKMILIDHEGQFIINKFATSKFLEEIDVLNKRAEQYYKRLSMNKL